MLISSNTNLYCLIGKYCSHSFGPVMHNAAFSYVNYDAVYLTFCVNDLREAILGIRNFGIKGCSVTMPYKIAVMEYLDEIDGDARKIGAVNTIINDGGYLIGYNSDSYGAMLALSEVTNISGANVAIIGYGGAARAVGYGIKKYGGKVKIIGRSEVMGRKLAYELGGDFCFLTDIAKVNCDILINATPIGMFPDFVYTVVSKQFFDSSCAVVMDLVTHPVDTELIKMALKMGCEVVNGLAMFVYQGVFQFELWTQKKAPVKLMEKTVKECIFV